MVRFLLALGIGLPILGGLFTWYGFKERGIAQESSQTPETIPLSKLIARGPEGNANIILTDYAAIRPYVIQRGRRGRYSGTWVPVVPKDAAQPDAPGGAPKAVKAFVYSTKGSDPEEVYRRLSNPHLPGMVSNKIMTPNSAAEDELQELFPQTDFSTCIYIHEGREVSSEEKSMLMIFGGIVAVLIGIACLGLCLLLWRKNAAKAQKKKGRFRDEYEDEDRPRKRRYSPQDDRDDDAPRRKRPRADDSEDEDRPRRRSRPRDQEEPPPRRRRPSDRDDDDYEDRPRRRHRRDDD
jgi:hypothetical protein